MCIPRVGGNSDTEISPKFGFPPPNINGKIDGIINEWGGATTSIVPIKTNPSDEGLNITVKSLLYFNNLYVLCKYELEPDSIQENEFLGLLIAETDSEDINNLTDGKVITISNSQDAFIDYSIQNFNFTEDPHQASGSIGAGSNSTIEGGIILMTYEFKIPLDSINSYDQKLEYGESYTFMICQGNNFSLPEGIVRNNSVSVSLETPSPLLYILLFNFVNPPLEENYEDIVPLVTKIIVFSIVYLSTIFYFTSILLSFNKKIRRLKKI